MNTYSECGYGYVVEKAATTKGWTFTTYEELWNYGFPQEMAHFARCVRGKDVSQSTGEDGVLFRKCCMLHINQQEKVQKVELPFRPKGIKRPIDLWLKSTGR